ncbi:Putative zn(2)Cys(6) fungal-type DNA-binding domain, fungal transcription factor [Colletotrichum destructivum]|uniref:Zn(2)Cys(6) fungal-type DNA-binding domain, fungal transcription factor n=1 Tax=Colletotrichum destructivum TaxID=34406 RepID=A0AAX4IPP4_9PEZI|nr:Putative zn(2)Cys(6) fungal-type DNA-binding domain, fungal transcription factor [Colletotrichum destructivum]
MNSTALSIASDEGDVSWSDNHSYSSDDNMQDDLLIPHSPASQTTPAWMNSAAISHSDNCPLSPASAAIDISNMNPSCAPTMVHSASSSCTDSWSNSHAEVFDGEQDSGDILTAPKLEPLDDDFNLDDVTEAPLATAQAPFVAAANQPKQKRPRGRPRKHPVAPIINPSKVTKGRSKTGCITCRRRKKKCDEAKPRCMNCEKNAVVCEGYHEKKLWRSGKEKATTDHLGDEESLVFTMQPLFNGVDTVEDKIFWRHYGVHLSNVLTVEGEAKNAFKDVILPLANLHQGVMHSILAMSSKHIDFETPYGVKLLEKTPTTNREALQARSAYHEAQAMKTLYADMNRTGDEDDDGTDRQTILSARYAQILCLVVTTLIEGEPHGAHRVHLGGYKRLIQESPPEDPVFLAFITEFFQYHIYADELLWHPTRNCPRLASEGWSSLVPLDSPRLLGVADGLFHHLCHITTIRNTIRENIYRGADTVVTYHILYQAQEIQEAIEQWMPTWPTGDSRHRVGLVYKHMMFLHLFRTIYPPTSPQRRPSVFSVATSVATSVSSISSRRHSQISRPSTATSCASSPSLRPTTAAGFPSSMQPKREPSSRGPSRTSSMHESDAGSSSCAIIDEQRPASPPPIRRPPQHDNRITSAVDESLAIMEGFKPSDPALTLLLMPSLVIGTTCFEPAQQERIRSIVRSVRGYTGLRNCDRVLEVLEEVWHLMDFGDWVSVWDWQGVARRLGLDFLCT